MKTELYIGQSNLRGALIKYSNRFNLLEIRAELGRLPRTAMLRRWSDDVPKDFVFSIMLSREVGRMGPNYESELKLGLEAAESLKAKWIVLQTDPTIGPSQRSRQRLQMLFAQMNAEGRRIAWEPHGVWHEEEALMWTQSLGVHLVRDIFRGDAINQDIIYSRMPGIGTSSRMSARALENAANNLSLASEGYVIIGGDAAGKASQFLRSLLRDDGSISTIRHDELNSQEVFGESTDDDDTDDFDDDSEGEEPESASIDDDDESELESDDLDGPSDSDNVTDDESSDQDDTEPKRRHLPKKGQGAKRK